MAESIRVEVVCALAERQHLLGLDVASGTTARAAVMASGLAAEFPELDLASCPLGIFGKALANPEERVLEEGDRVEVYRPLLADPKEVRKARAARAAQARAAEE
ncbi:RnfH family protein [Pseudomonas tohonis]|uniref:RnfH family protein n=1 Tax=Pseudomonas tohonis TaxID=2725477 RepID=UPI0021D99220|nr:RnfH family protein [Pseudomonas tohonis]UXY52296.1 RnfH family protein [Pseudomonas tohonis]